MDLKHFKLFVYGSLKRGESHHEIYCSRATSIEEATIHGEVYPGDHGYPFLVIPAGCTSVVRGELITLPDPETTLPPIDDWEDYKPGGKSLYERVRTVATTNDGETHDCWVYVKATNES